MAFPMDERGEYQLLFAQNSIKRFNLSDLVARFCFNDSENGLITLKNYSRHVLAGAHGRD